MGANSREFFEVMVRAEMSEQTYQDIPNELKESIVVKAVEIPKRKEDYKADDKWCQLNKSFIEALKAKKQREDEIRAGL